MAICVTPLQCIRVCRHDRRPMDGETVVPQVYSQTEPRTKLPHFISTRYDLSKIYELGMQGLFLDTFLTNQLNWSWQFLSFSEILLEFFQNLS